MIVQSPEHGILQAAAPVLLIVKERKEREIRAPVRCAVPEERKEDESPRPLTITRPVEGRDQLCRSVPVCPPEIERKKRERAAAVLPAGDHAH